MASRPTETLAQALADELAQAGVDRVFGLPGGEVLFVIEALRERGIEFVLCRHEADAGIMAAVYGKLKGTVGVALTTLGPGAANLMLPLSNSWLDREPLLAISATAPDTWPMLHTHQLLPLLEVYQPVTKFAHRVSGFNARETVRQAIASASTEPLGPAYLTLSADDARSSAFSPLQSQPSRTSVAATTRPADVAATDDELRRRLSDAERPMVLLGLGVRPEVAPALRQWIDAWKLPVAVTPKVKGIVDEDSPNFVGVVGGMSIDNVLVDALQHADLLIGFGFDPVEVDKTWHSTLPITWVLESALATGVYPRSDLFVANHAALLDRLNEHEPPRSWDDPFEEFKQRRHEVYQSGHGTTNGTMAPTRIVRSLASALPPNTIVTTDVGSHKYLFGQFWPSHEPQSFFMSNGLSGMGYGLPAAIAAKLARPDSPVLATLGDGGFSMNSQELETARRIGANIIAVVLADNSYSLIRKAQESRGLPNYGVDFTPIDTVKTAEACGVAGLRTADPDELTRAVRRAAERDESLVVEVPVNPDDYSGLV